MTDLRIEPLANHPTYEKVRDLDKGEEVAIKFIQLGPRFYSKYVERELFNHRLLAHPHIVSFKEVFITSHWLAIVMEYVGGGNLQQYVEKKSRLPEWEARCFFQQLILALDYCHRSVNVAHRDIKLGNILLNTKYAIPILKICDFGYSKNMILNSIPKTRVGTAAYISPEVARSQGDCAYDTEKADVWSCGVTLYCMLAGRYPFVDVDQQIRLRRIQDLTQADVATALSKLRGVSAECVSLLQRVLQVDPVKRLALLQIMEDPWFRQFLPDLSKLNLAPPKDTQAESEIKAILTDAERLSHLRSQTSFDEDELEHDMDDILAEIDPNADIADMDRSDGMPY
ncbi:hypothetical protein N2152v2_007546 [Parachlorella kessleri]